MVKKKSDNKRRDALNKVTRALARRDHTRWELWQKLQKSYFEIETIEEVLEHVERLGYIDDEKFAEKFGFEQIRRKPLGRLLLRAKLRQKGIDSESIERSLDRIFSEFCEDELALRYLNMRRQQIDAVSSEQKLEKIARLLQNRGFSAETISETLNRFRIKK